MTDRDKILEKVRALLAKTIENGCTEAEALAAAEAAARMMEDYEISRDDISSVRDDSYTTRTTGPYGRTVHPAMRCARALQTFCGVKIWREWRRTESGVISHMKIFGAQADTEMAEYLLTIIQIALERECAAFLKDPRRRPAGYHANTLRTSFMVGMVIRICQRLNELSKERQQRMQTSERGNALVVVKEEELERRYLALDLKLTTSASRTKARSRVAYEAGSEAGERVSFGRPVGHGTLAIE